MCFPTRLSPGQTAIGKDHLISPVWVEPVHGCTEFQAIYKQKLFLAKQGYPGLVLSLLNLESLLNTWVIIVNIAIRRFAPGVPLSLFGAATRRIPLSLIGMIQYMAPTMHLLLGVFLYHEPFTRARLIGFSFIWIALVIFVLEGLYTLKKSNDK